MPLGWSLGIKTILDGDVSWNGAPRGFRSKGILNDLEIIITLDCFPFLAESLNPAKTEVDWLNPGSPTSRYRVEEHKILS